MLPLHLFRNARFTGAGLTITVLFFALSGVVFLNSQILQFVLGYSPLAAGVRALPSAAALAVFSPVGASLAKRAGALVPVALGLAAVTGGLALFATASAASGYGHYVLAMVIVCAGIGLAMSAATAASMQELPPAMAGVGSAVNDTTRNMGSVLGVAVIGSVTASVFASRMAHLAHGTSGQLGRPDRPRRRSALARSRARGAGGMVLLPRRRRLRGGGGVLARRDRGAAEVLAALPHPDRRQPAHGAPGFSLISDRIRLGTGFGPRSELEARPSASTPCSTRGRRGSPGSA